MGEHIGKVTKVTDKYIETDTKLKLNVQDGICFDNNGEFSGFKINKISENKIYPNKMPKITKGTCLYRNFDFEFNREIESAKIIRKIGVIFEIYDNKITAKDEDNNEVTIRFANTEPAKNPEKARQNLIKQIEKVGNSDFYVIETEIYTKNIPFIPVSKINEIRRNILDDLMNERINKYKRPLQKPLKYTKFYQYTTKHRADEMQTLS